MVVIVVVVVGGVGRLQYVADQLAPSHREYVGRARADPLIVLLLPSVERHAE